MAIHITNLYGQQKAAGISQNKTASIAKELGFHEMEIYRYDTNVDNDSELGTRLDGILAPVYHGDIIFIQSPSWNGLRYDLRFVRKLRAYSNIKIVMLIHDVIPLGFNSGEANLRATIEIYNYADLIIAPSQAMLDLLNQYGLSVKKQMVQQLWDYPISFEPSTPQFQKRLFFTGNPNRFPFLNEWNGQTQITLYTDADFIVSTQNITTRKYQKEEHLMMQLSEGGYGLVWSSNEANNYYRLLQPYKVANYLAAGIPVIMQRGLVPEHIILQNKLGYVVDTLEEADAIVQTVTPDQYHLMTQHISEFNMLIRNGWFTKKMLSDAVMYLMNDSYTP